MSPVAWPEGGEAGWPDKAVCQIGAQLPTLPGHVGGKYIYCICGNKLFRKVRVFDSIVRNVVNNLLTKLHMDRITHDGFPG